MRDTYALFECNSATTKALCEMSRAAGIETWVPLVFKHKVDKTGKVTKHTVAAIPGYIFVPYQDWRSFMTWLSFNNISGTRICMTGPPDYRRTIKVHLSELEILNQACHELSERSPESGPVFKAGDRVKITFGVFEGFEGQVCSTRNNSVRVLIGTKYVGLPIVFVEKL